MDKELREQIESVAREMHKVWSTCGEHESSKFEVFCFLAKWHIQRTLEARIFEYEEGKGFEDEWYLNELKSQLQQLLKQLKDG